MTTTTDVDVPDITRTPGGWLAVATDDPLIGVTATTEEEALRRFRDRREAWRALLVRNREDRASQ